jgi:hypothetical protein
MSAITYARFGEPESIHAAACANAAFTRAINLGYSRTCAQQFARVAKKDCSAWESPDHCALRIVIPKRATFAGHSQ